MEEQISKKHIRLFIAVTMPAAVINEIAHIAEHFKALHLFKGAYVHPENIHITLKFLGAVAQEKIPEIDQLLQNIAGKAMKAQLSSLDMFFLRHAPKILFLDVICPELIELVSECDKTLSQFFKPESRSFVYHLTIARIKKVMDNERLLHEVSHYAVNPITFTIDNFTLIQSQLTQNGSTYRNVAIYTLK
ncbi:MAG: RNA 2',3'-cyclic phosphodiesterase [Candidatus Babeliales bacterium]|nr:RNA 2',3'-cyclic phosphodiesterase [Candidatus Babeliales bacterium]